MADGPTVGVWTEVLAGGVRLCVPVGVAALGELVGERSGVMNLGIEGQMSLGAVFGFMAASTSKNLWLGLLIGLIVGAMVGAAFAGLIIRIRTNQIVVGFAIALGGVGLANFVYRSLYQNTAAATVPALPIIAIPGLSNLPVLGPVLFRQAPFLVWLLPILTIGIAWLLRSTTVGLAIRASGFSPAEASARGVPTGRLRSACVIFGGGMSGLAGALLSVAIVGQYTEGMIAGRGFVALALVIASGWRPYWLLAASFLFGSLQSLGLDIQTISPDLPVPLISILPFAATLLVLAFGFSSHTAPTALAQPNEED